MKSRENRKQYWQEQLKSFYASGLTQREYCRTSNLSYWSFNQWKRRLENEENSSSLTEVRIKPENPETSSDNKIKISLNNSIRISLPVEISPEVLIYIIKSLGDTSCI